MGEMNEHREPLDNETAERLLDGDFASARGDAANLASLLASAASAPQAHELAGEDAAMLTFRAAQQQRSRQRASLWRRLITFKVIAVVGAATAGSLAFASSTGILPSPFSIIAQPPPQVAPTDSDRPGAPTTHPGPSLATPHPSGSAEAPISPDGLCHAYLAKPPSERGKALDTPAFAQLIVLAGGSNNVDAYCQGLEADKKEKSHSPPAPRRAQ